MFATQNYYFNKICDEEKRTLNIFINVVHLNDLTNYAIGFNGIKLCLNLIQNISFLVEISEIQCYFCFQFSKFYLFFLF